MRVLCKSQLGPDSRDDQPGCGEVYDDARQWTICPHNPLTRGVEEVVCKQHDLFDCPHHEKASEPAERLHYFDMDKAPSDTKLEMTIYQGYVPATCLLSGAIVLDEVNKGRNPCRGCEGPRAKCGGRPKA